MYRNPNDAKWTVFVGIDLFPHHPRHLETKAVRAEINRSEGGIFRHGFLVDLQN